MRDSSSERGNAAGADGDAGNRAGRRGPAVSENASNSEARATSYEIDRRELLQVTAGGALAAGPGMRSVSASEPGVADGTTVYIGSHDGTLYAVDAATGDQTWAFTQPSGGVNSSPTVVHGIVYVGAENATLYAVDAATGEMLWTFESAATAVESSPTVVGGTVYVGSGGGTLYAVDAATGEQEWAFTEPSGYISSSPAMVDGTVYIGVGYDDYTLYAVDATTGEQEWAFTQPGSSVNSSPTVVDGTVYVGSSDGTLYAVDAETGETDWSFELPNRISSSPVVVDSTVYFGYTKPADVIGRVRYQVYALDAQTGSVEWEFTTWEVQGSTGRVGAEVTVVGDTVFAAARDGKFYALDRSSGTEQWSLEIGARDLVPTVHDGAAYVTTGAGIASVNMDASETNWEFTQPSDGMYAAATVVDDPLDGHSVDSRINLGTLGHHHAWAGEDPGNEPPPPPDTITGTVTGPDEEPVDTGTAYLVDSVYEGAVVEYVAGEGSLPETEAETTVAAGEFQFEGVTTGRHFVVVNPSAPLDPAYRSVSVQAGEGTAVSLTVTAERHLAPLDSTVERLADAATGVVADSTADLAAVYVDGAQLFEDELDEGDFLPGLLETTDFALALATGTVPPSQQIASFAASNVAITFAEHGHNHVLASKLAAVEDTTFQGDLRSYTSTCLETDWITNLDNSSAESTALEAFKGTPMYESAVTSIENAAATYDDIAVEEPAEGFSMAAVKSVLETQARWLEDDGLAPGVLMTPQGSGYVTRETRYHAAHYDGIRANFDAAEGLETFSTGVAVAGKSATVVGTAGGPLAAVGLVGATAGWVGSMVFSMYQVHLKNKLGGAWVDSLTYWLSDLDDAPVLLFELVDWLDTELDTPTLQAVDGSIDSSDIGGVTVDGKTFVPANEPAYPLWWPVGVPKPLWRRNGTNTVSITNTGDTTTSVQVIAVDTYGDGQSGGVSDAVSMYPHEFADDPVSLNPDESVEVAFEYSSNFHPFDPFNWHHMSISLWMNGMTVDEVETPYYIVPSLDILPLDGTDERGRDLETSVSEADLQTSIHTNEYLLTDGSKPPGEAMTVDDWLDNVGDITPLLEETTLTPEQEAASVTYEVPAGARGVVFTLNSPSEAELNLGVENDDGQFVGYDPDAGESVVEIPTAEYNGHESKLEVISITDATGSYEVDATAVRFLTDDETPVSLYAVEIPEREASLAVSPARADLILKSGTSETATIELAEAGNQAGIDVTGIAVGPFETPQGSELTDVDVSLSETNVEIPAGAETSVDLAATADQSVSLPDSPVTRFWSDLTVETANAGTAVLDASILIFDTDVADVTLTQAGPDVEGVSLTAIEGVPSEPPDEVTVLEQYEVEIVGEGAVSLSVPVESLPDTEKVTAYRIDDGWTELDTAVGERLAVDLSATGSTVVALTTVDVGPPPVLGDQPPTDLDGDGRFEDVNGDGTFDIFDVQALFENLDSDAVQNNPAAFNFSGGDSSTVDIFDVQALFDQLGG